MSQCRKSETQFTKTKLFRKYLNIFFKWKPKTMKNNESTATYKFWCQTRLQQIYSINHLSNASNRTIFFQLDTNSTTLNKKTMTFLVQLLAFISNAFLKEGHIWLRFPWSFFTLWILIHSFQLKNFTSALLFFFSWWHACTSQSQWHQ